MNAFIGIGYLRNSLFRGVLKTCSTTCVPSKFGGHKRFASQRKFQVSSPCISVTQSCGILIRPVNQLYFRNDCSSTLFILSSKLQAGYSVNCARSFSARPLRDVKSDRRPDEISGRVRCLPNEVCLISGKSAEVCSCSVCTDQRAHMKSVVNQDDNNNNNNKGSNDLQTTAAVNHSSDDPNQQVTSTTVEKKPGLFKRFKMMYKQYGVVMFCVHWSLATVWTSMFYYAAISGIDVVPILKWLGASDAVISPFLRPAIGHAAVTYLLYKLATPIRYTVTFAGTQLAVKYLRKWGYLKTPEASDSLRSMVSESRTKVKDKMEEVRDKVEDKMEEVRDKMELVRDRVEDRLDDFRDDFRDKLGEVREKVEDRLDNIRDDVSELKGKFQNFRNQKLDGSGLQTGKNPQQQKL